YTFTGDASALICFQFPYGWDDYENVTFFIDDVENHVADMTMSLIVKTRYKSWATIDPAHGDRYPILDEGSNSLTYPIFAFTDGASLQFNQYGHSTNWTLHVTKLVFHDGLISDLEAV
ncbi:MAG: hypothetical protein FWD88_06550, partial [Treponema sp.]|nr:hypothetical protein [Treponema sp.]